MARSEKSRDRFSIMKKSFIILIRRLLEWLFGRALPKMAGGRTASTAASWPKDAEAVETVENLSHRRICKAAPNNEEDSHFVRE